MQVSDKGPENAQGSTTRHGGGAFTPTPKTPEQLKKQISALESALNVSFTPHAESQQHILKDLSVKELREFHATRYNAMVTILPYIKRGEPVPEEIKERFATRFASSTT